MSLGAMPTRLGSRRIREHVKTITLTPGAAPEPITLKRGGFLTGILVHIRGTVTATGDPAPKPGFPHNIVRYRLDVPGLADPISGLMGHALKVLNAIGYERTMQRPGHRPSVFTAPTWEANAFAASDLDESAPVAVAANVWRLWQYIPLARNLRDLRGTRPMVDDDDVILEITPMALAEIFSTPANIGATALTVEVYQDTITPPLPGYAPPPTGHALVIDQKTTNVAATGDVEIDLRRDGIVLAVAHLVWLDDDLFPPAPEASIEALTLLANRDALLQSLPFRAYAHAMYERYPVMLPAGVIVYDFDQEQADLPFAVPGVGEVTPGWLYAESLRDLTSTIRIAAAAALDNAKIHTITKRLVPAPTR